MCGVYSKDFMRTVLAKTVADFIEFQDLNATEATKKGIQYLTEKVNGRGGIIVINNQGRCDSGFITKRILYGWIEYGGEAVCIFNLFK